MESSGREGIYEQQNKEVPKQLEPGVSFFHGGSQRRVGTARTPTRAAPPTMRAAVTKHKPPRRKCRGRTRPWFNRALKAEPRNSNVMNPLNIRCRRTREMYRIAQTRHKPMLFGNHVRQNHAVWHNATNRSQDRPLKQRTRQNRYAPNNHNRVSRVTPAKPCREGKRKMSKCAGGGRW